MEIPAVSVIIPMYNAEKFIGACLNSILAQTFKNFEVIIVDDCSSDNGVAIVESFAEKFGGRLILVRLEKNSGNAGYTARNKGLTFSRGEYIYFADADDMLTKNALTIMYTVAKKLDADIVYTSARYLYTADKGAEFKTDKHRRMLINNGKENKISLIVNNPHKILQWLLIERGLFHTPWTKFVKRDFLLRNEITFCETMSGGDFIWTIELFARAKRFVRIPHAVYLYRDDSTSSMTRDEKPLNEQISKWSKIFVQWAKNLSALNNKLEILKQNPQYAYGALTFWLKFCLKHNLKSREKIKSQAVYGILRREFPDDLTLPFLFSALDEQEKIATANTRRIAALEAEIKRLKAKE